MRYVNYLKNHCVYFLVGPYKECRPFALIHSNICGPSRVITLIKTRWFITFINDHTRVYWIYLLKKKSEAKKVFKIDHVMIKTQFQTQIQVVGIDNGKEFFNYILGNYLLENGIIL